MSTGWRRKAVPWLGAPIIAIGLASCGSPGTTTCGQFVKKTEEQRLNIIDEWEPSLTDKQAAFKERYLYTSCADPDVSDPGDRIEDIHG